MLFFGHNSAITNFVNKFGIFIDNVSTSGFVSEFETND
jgi:hypothetical protein